MLKILENIQRRHWIKDIWMVRLICWPWAVCRRRILKINGCTFFVSQLAQILGKIQINLVPTSGYMGGRGTQLWILLRGSISLETWALMSIGAP